MQHLSRSILGLRPRVGSAWHYAFVRRDAPLMESASSNVNYLERLSRIKQSPRVGCGKKQGEVQHMLSACAYTTCMETKKMSNQATEEVMDRSNSFAIDIWYPIVYKDSSHRDGAIYKNELLRREWFEADITDRREIRVEPMLFLRDTKEYGHPQHMLQFFSLTLVNTPMSKRSIELYGYIAVRDERDWMLNYIYNRGRDDPIIAQQGHDIEMTGPKRAIDMSSPVLIEFDMRLRNGELDEDDLEVIDGAFSCNVDRPWKPVKHRISGRSGTVDISLAFVWSGVEATIEVLISEVQSVFSLSISSLVSIVGNYEEIQLLHGTIDQPCGLRRFVVAVTVGTEMLLRFKVGNHIERLSFEAMEHGYEREHIKFDVASVAVKVTWSTI